MAATGFAGAVVVALRARVDAQRARRTATLVRLGGSRGMRYATMNARSRFADEDTAARLRTRFELETAEQVAEVLGNMKGAMMKLGQMASYLDQGLPEPVREVLSQLQADAPPMAPNLVAEAIRAEFGRSASELFASFDPEPIAAASIGQVHRAITHDGRDVAVKVQYPGVDAAIRADLANTDLLFTMMSFLFPGMDPGPIVTELRTRLSEELDYRSEAAFQRRFAAYYRGHPTIHVPAVVDELSGERVLTTEFAAGASWSELLTWPQDQRDLTAETMYRYAFGGIYRLGLFNGDPHPGNYVFGADGRVTFLDYGLCKEFTGPEIENFERMIRAMVIDHDMGEVRRVWADLGILTDPDRFTDDALRDYFIHFFESVMIDETITQTPEYASESVRRYFDLSGPHQDLIKSVTLPSFMVIVQRINLGLFALFGELHATANWRRMAEEIWPITDGPPSTPMGERIREWELATAKRSTGVD